MRYANLGVSIFRGHCLRQDFFCYHLQRQLRQQIQDAIRAKPLVMSA